MVPSGSNPTPYSDDLPTFWRGKKVFLTGHTGFKGGWLALWLQRLGAEVYGFALAPDEAPNLFTLAQVASGMAGSVNGDIRDFAQLAAALEAARPEVVFHLAAQALVRASYAQPVETYATNVMGTVHLLEAVRRVPTIKVVVNVTSDKCYDNREWPWGYRENEPLGGADPYSSSKGCAELVTAAYRHSYFSVSPSGLPPVAVATARAGNVIGGGDWAADRLLPDAVRAWQAGEPLVIRRPQATRPWQHVLEPLAGYLVLAEKLIHQPELAGAYNFGPDAGATATVREVVEMAQASYGQGQVEFAEALAGPHEAGWLALDNAKARLTLGVNPCWSLGEAVERTMVWYRRLAAGADARELCRAEIAEYEARL